MPADLFQSHRCPHCGCSNGWRGPLRDQVRFEGGVSLAQGRCRHCNGVVLAKENPKASALMGLAVLALVALFAHGWWPLPPWGVLAGMVVFCVALIGWIAMRLTGRGFLLKPPDSVIGLSGATQDEPDTAPSEATARDPVSASSHDDETGRGFKE